ncbi:hypothetical protein GYMLUDRAFT_61751 [Collybiopsis luxurians FD-317 M1]|uniref:Peptidase A1 domain-containing protein n=1 Tax=Collybiopsis luxurians FD-317 M1 TaxID=944289 RepID=A0A0D0CFN4_9AGAR|nr:hypothetical protein GYMLUDRAFT_61751 [Collybiopsis luxurians FD-317 M1]
MGYPTQLFILFLPDTLLSFSWEPSSRGNRPQWKRDSDIGNGSQTLSTVLLSNVLDQLYTCNITLGGKSVEVQFDTGCFTEEFPVMFAFFDYSSNLVIPGKIPNSKNLSIPLNMINASGNGTALAPGYIDELEFAGYTIENQAFLHAALGQLTTGIIGVSMGNVSTIRHALNSSAGDTILNRIFRQNSTNSTDNYITLLLGRFQIEYSNSGSSQPFLENQQSIFTIGEVVYRYEEIHSSPKLPNAL